MGEFAYRLWVGMGAVEVLRCFALCGHLLSERPVSIHVLGVATSGLM